MRFKSHDNTIGCVMCMGGVLGGLGDRVCELLNWLQICVYTKDTDVCPPLLHHTGIHTFFTDDLAISSATPTCVSHIDNMCNSIVYNY